MSEFRAPQIIYVSAYRFPSDIGPDDTFDMEDHWTCCEDRDDARAHLKADMARDHYEAGAICVVIASDEYDEGSIGEPLRRALNDPDQQLVDFCGTMLEDLRGKE